jgi:hypothetical protein
MSLGTGDQTGHGKTPECSKTIFKGLHPLIRAKTVIPVLEAFQGLFNTTIRKF